MVTCGLSGGAEGWSRAGCSWHDIHYEVGNTVEMQFADDRWYRGVVADFQRRSRLFKICFEDGDEWRLSLPDPFVRRVAHEGRVGAEKSHCHPPPPSIRIAEQVFIQRRKAKSLYRWLERFSSLLLTLCQDYVSTWRRKSWTLSRVAAATPRWDRWLESRGGD